VTRMLGRRSRSRQRREGNGFGRDRSGVNPRSPTRRVDRQVSPQCAGIGSLAACQGGDRAISPVTSDQRAGASPGAHSLRRCADVCRTWETEPNQGEHAGGDALLVCRPCARHERTVDKPNCGDRKFPWGVVRSARGPMMLLAPPSRGEQLAGWAHGWAVGKLTR
jgi:hypothetical protein